jgi:hypothetical protein
MGYLTKEIKPTWFITKAGFQQDGKEVKAAFFGDIKGDTELRARKWLAKHQPVFKPRIIERPTLRLVANRSIV